MFKEFRKKHGITKQEVKASIELFQEIAKVRLHEAMTITYEDSIMLSSKALKAVLFAMGWGIQSIEVRKGDKVSYNGTWSLEIDMGNINNPLIGVFTKLTHAQHQDIENFTNISYIKTIAEIGGPNWEKWYDESAIMAALKQTLRRSTLSFIAKPILATRLEDLEEESVGDTNLIEEILNEATIEEVQRHSEVDIPTTVEKPLEVETSISREDELVNELTKEWGGWIKIRPGRNLSREDWKTNRDILENFGANRDEDDKKVLSDLLNSVKPYGIKSEEINFHRTDNPVSGTEELISEIVEDVSSPVIAPNEDNSEAPIEEEVETPPESPTEIHIESTNEDFSTPFDKEEPKSTDADMEAWKEAKRSLEKKWLEGPGEDEELLSEKEALIDSVPEGLAIGPIKVGKPWARYPHGKPEADTTVEETAPAKTEEKPMTARQWMVAFGSLERRFSDGEKGDELYQEALKLKDKTPEHINSDMLNPNKYLGEE